ncbi:hypothetical protein AB5I41_14460 [Sphingomonas sp. MMS24-JH45]
MLRAARFLLEREAAGDFDDRPGRASRMTLATPYNVFGSKAAILHGVFAADVDRFHRTMNDATPGSPLAALLGVADVVAHAIAQRPSFYRALHLSVLQLGAEETDAWWTELGETAFDACGDSARRGGAPVAESFPST